MLGARLSTRGIPRLARSRASPCPALEVRGIQGTASERITTVSLDSTRSQLFSNGTGHPPSLGSGRCGVAYGRSFLCPGGLLRTCALSLLLGVVCQTWIEMEITLGRSQP